MSDILPFGEVPLSRLGPGGLATRIRDLEADLRNLSRFIGQAKQAGRVRVKGRWRHGAKPVQELEARRRALEQRLAAARRRLAAFDAANEEREGHAVELARELWA